MKSNVEATSRRERGLWEGTRRNKSKISAAAPPVGRFIQKHHLQETWSVSTPPTSGPTTLAIPQVAPIKPPYFPLSSRDAKRWSEVI